MDGDTLSRLEGFNPGKISAGWRLEMRPHSGAHAITPQNRLVPELIYQCRSRGSYRINNRPVVLEPGELLLLGQNALLESPAQEPAMLAVRFFLQPELIGDILRFLGSDPSPLREFILRCLGQETPYGYLHFRTGGQKPVANVMENLVLHFLDNPESRRAIPMFTLGLLFLHLVDQTDRLVVGVKEQQTILGVLQYVEANYPTASLQSVAQILHSDVSWLSREIRRRTGRTFTELVQERRLSQAAWLLKNTRQRVSDIALSVGYENISYFHRIFAKRYGVSPKKYRDMD